MRALLYRIVAIASISGVVTGVLLTGIQLWLVLPKIETAEEYEQQVTISNAQSLAAPVSKGRQMPSGAVSTASHSDDHPHHLHERLNAGMRVFWTMVANISTSFGFALLLVAMFFLRGRGDLSQGLFLGGVGFVVFFLNPSLGVPPQIPGGQSVGLVNHQLWWLSMVVLSLIAAAGLVMSKKLWIKAVSVLLLMLPHLFGSPQREVPSGAAQEALVHDFVTAITITNGVFWLMLGLISAFIYQHQMRSQL